QHFEDVRPTSSPRHGERRTFIFKDLTTTNQVFVRRDAPKGPLQMVYDGPYQVLRHGPKTFTIAINGREVTISIDRLKPAYIIADDPTEQPEVAPEEAHTPTENPPENGTPEDATSELSTQAAQASTSRNITRHGRRVRFPEYLQAGFGSTYTIHATHTFTYVAHKSITGRGVL
ncbi:hypothetical protein NQ315_002090, partial [Exocentrus adspersus]